MSTHTFSPQSQAAVDRFRAALAWSAVQDALEQFPFAPLRVSVTPLVGEAEYDDMQEAEGRYPWEPEYEMCECEIDWSCGLHRGRIPFIERQWDEQAWHEQERGW
jgi:hypothetical protein